MKQNQIKVGADGFVWKVVDRATARDILNTGIFQLYGLCDDDSDFEINSIERMEHHLDCGGQVGIEVGFINEIDN
jgi:hypothetical protein